MFTGIIEELGVLRSVRRGTSSARLVIEAKKILEDIRTGDSIAVNGVCLTAAHFNSGEFAADVMAETLSKTDLGTLNAGDRVNLERALRLGDRLGGHLVSGHIDGTGSITRLKKHDIAILVTIGAPVEVMRYIIKKGSVAVDGISLTVVDFNRDGFQVSLVPHTAGLTSLGFKKTGDTVNLEADVIGKYIEKMMDFREYEKRESKINFGFLAEHGFI